MEGHRVKLTEVNPYLVCVLCHGYLVDATTIAECLHSFCRSCIFRQLSRESICPICKTQVHNTKLYRSLRPDKTLQDIVYKLVPGLFHNEMQRRRDFYKNHPYRDEHLEPECRGVGLDRLIYSPDDQISLSLEFYDEEREKEEWSNHSSPKPAQTAPSGPKRYLQCPAGFKMLHLKKFLRQKYGLSQSCNVDIMYRRECLPDSYSLMDVAYIYTWKRNSPMRFYYRMPDVIMKQLMAPPAETPILPNGNAGNVKEIKENSIKKNSQETVLEETEKNIPDASVKKDGEKSDIKTQLDSKKAETDESTLPESKDSAKSKSDSSPGSSDKNGPRPVSKNDELPVSVLLSLGQTKVDNNDDHKFLIPQGVPPKNGITDKKNNKISLKLSVNKIASDLAENKAQQQNNENIRANSQETTVQQQQSPKLKHPNVPKGYYTKQKHIQPKTQQTILQKQQMQLLKQQQLQHKQQQLLQQKQQIQQIIQQQQELQLQIQQQQQQIQLQQKQKLQQQQQKLQLQQQQQQQQIQQQHQIQHQQIQQQLRQQKLNSLQQHQTILISTPHHIAPHQSPNPYIEQVNFDCQTKQTLQNSPHHAVLHVNIQNNMLHKAQLVSQVNSQQQILSQNQVQQIQQTLQNSESQTQKNAQHSSQSNPTQRLEQVPTLSQLPSQSNMPNSLQQQPQPSQNSNHGPKTGPSVNQAGVPPAQVESITPPPQGQGIKTPPLQKTPPPQNSTPPLRCTPPPQVSVPAVVNDQKGQTTKSSLSSNQSVQPINNQEKKDQNCTVPLLAQTNVSHLCGGNVNINSDIAQQNSQLGMQQQAALPQQGQTETPQQQPTQNIQQQLAQSNQQSPTPQLQLQQNREASATNGQNKVQSPQVTLNTSNGSVTIMAQPKNLQSISPTPNSPDPSVINGKTPDTPRPQGIHQNLPRTVLPKTSFVNGKPPQKAVPQKNISGQRLNNNIPELRNGLIQQSNINNRLPTFQKSGGMRKAGIPGGVLSKTGPTLDQRIQQLYNSGQTNKPPSPNGGKSESRLANWLNNRFKPQSPKDEAEPTTPPASGKEVSMIRYKRKLQELQKGQEMCEITQENPRPDDAKRRREVMPDVSIELMRAADIKKLEGSGGKKEKRPVPGLKSIQEVGAKRKKEDDSVLDLSAAKPGEVLRPQLPWLVSRPPHFIPRPT